MSRRKRSQARGYRLQYAEQARGHLAALQARHRVTVIERVDALLAFQPTIETRNRKRMNENPLGASCESRTSARTSRRFLGCSPWPTAKSAHEHRKPLRPRLQEFAGCAPPTGA